MLILTQVWGKLERNDINVPKYDSKVAEESQKQTESTSNHY